MIPREYKVIQASTPEELAHKVQRLAATGGYEPHGGVATGTDPNGLPIYIQAMVLQ